MSMKVIQRRDVIRGVRDRWNEQYGKWEGAALIGRNREPVSAIRARLAALDLEKCSQADVDTAVGVDGWAKNKCDVCGRDVPVLMHIGEEPDYEARWQEICLDCPTKA